MHGKRNYPNTYFLYGCILINHIGHRKEMNKCKAQNSIAPTRDIVAMATTVNNPVPIVITIWLLVTVLYKKGNKSLV